VGIFIQFLDIEVAANMITICIPTYNSERTLRQVVEAVAKRGNYQFLIYDNGSTDGTKEIIADLQKKYRIKTKIVPHKNVANRHLNINRMYTEFVKDVETDYMFSLDSDVVINEKIEELIPYLNERVGAVGYSYQPANHLQMGAVMMRTETARKINWEVSSMCPCMNMANELKKL
jgi:glycosyltransferase involved in cell wall biosynthesis